MSIPRLFAAAPLALVSVLAGPAAALAAETADEPAADRPDVDGSGLELTAAPPEVLATLASDGSYTIRLVPRGPWRHAELSVSGDGSHDLAATDGSMPVMVAGTRDGMGPIGLHLAVVTPEQHGVSWSFTVEPELLPVAAPTPEPEERRRRWPFGRRDR